MISSPLFRAGDRVRYRKDLQTHTEYYMIWNDNQSCGTGSSVLWVDDHRGEPIVIAAINTNELYTADGLSCLVDTIFEEGARIRKYLDVVTESEWEGEFWL